jgi:hypothetical protein
MREAGAIQMSDVRRQRLHQRPRWHITGAGLATPPKREAMRRRPARPPPRCSPTTKPFATWSARWSSPPNQSSVRA